MPAWAGRQPVLLGGEMTAAVARSRSKGVGFAGEVVAVAVVTVNRLLGCKGQFGSPWLVSTPKAPRIE